MSILDPRFRYTSSISTDVMNTWKKFGFKPPSEGGRSASVTQQNEARTFRRRHRPVPDFLFRATERASGAPR